MEFALFSYFSVMLPEGSSLSKLGVVDDTQGTGSFCLWVSYRTPKGKLPVPDVRFARFRYHLMAEMGKTAISFFFLKVPPNN